ncbi:MAG: TatD family hydrolase [Candidatus Thorarchaeota archaeon]
MTINKLSDVRLIDTHSHIAGHEFDDDLSEIMEESSRLGLAIISSSIENDEWDRNLEICRKYELLFASIGLNPEKWTETEAAIKVIRENSPEIVSIGEVGLDHYKIRDHKERELQRTAFVEIIGLATELSLPIQIHSRSAGRAALEVLEKENASLVHMHAFDGKSSLARMASNDLEYYFSIPTSVVRSPQKRKLVKAVNIERLLIETDSPVLAPEKGTRNTPLNLPIVIQEIARILRRDEEELQRIILENTLRLYSRIKF